MSRSNSPQNGSPPAIAEPPRYGDARQASRSFAPASVDLVVTSPPYWRKRDYGHAQQLGQEKTPAEFVETLGETLDSWRPLFKNSSSVFLNIADTMREGALCGVPALFEVEMMRRGWKVLARIVWTKATGLPDPHGRLLQRHEFVFHLAPAPHAVYADLWLYSQHFDARLGNVWPIESRPAKRGEQAAHLAPFPLELARRAILLGCPERVCAACGAPIERRTRRGFRLDMARPQARRAQQIFDASDLDESHLEAIRATGICDAGKSLQFQNGAGCNAAAVAAKAREAKQVLGGYFREFTFGQVEHHGWQTCSCGGAADDYCAGFVLDPFAGSGTTLRAAHALGRRCAGLDLMAER